MHNFTINEKLPVINFINWNFCTSTFYCSKIATNFFTQSSLLLSWWFLPNHCRVFRLPWVFSCSPTAEDVQLTSSRGLTHLSCLGICWYVYKCIMSFLLSNITNKVHKTFFNSAAKHLLVILLYMSLLNLLNILSSRKQSVERFSLKKYNLFS